MKKLALVFLALSFSSTVGAEDDWYSSDGSKIDSDIFLMVVVE